MARTNLTDKQRRDFEEKEQHHDVRIRRRETDQERMRDIDRALRNRDFDALMEEDY